MPTSPQSWYALNKASAEEAELSIYDAIGAYGVTAQQFIKDLKAIDAKRLNVRLNTPGGEVFDGTAIHNALREHPATVVMHIDGLAASAGSFIAMAGDEIRMADNAYLMIHNAWGGAMGEAKDMRKLAEVLDKMSANIAGMYAAKTGKPVDHYRALMDAETWFTADEAKEEGLVDTVTTATKKDAGRAKAAFDFKIYNQAKIPDAVKAAWGISTNPPNQPSPAAASLESEPAPAIQQESTPMANDNPQANPAPTPAAEPGPVSQGNPAPKAIDAAEAHQRELDRLKGLTAEAQFNQGRVKGVTDGRAEQVERLKQIVAVCPGKPQMAIDAFLTGQAPEAVKLAFDAAAKVEAEARVRDQEKDLEIARWQNLAATGGYPGGVGVAMGNEADEPTGLDPKVQAEQEWDHKPNARKGFTSKERYVAVRVAELTGKFRRQEAQTAKV